MSPNRYLDSILTGLILAYPALLLGVHSGMNGAFVLLLLVSCIALYRTDEPRVIWDRNCILFVLAMAAPVIAIFFSQAAHLKFKAADYDWAARFLFAIPIYLALRRSDLKTLPMLQYGMVFGTLSALIILMLHPFDWEFHRLTTGGFVNLIHFSDLALMLGFLCLFSINRTQLDSWPLLILKAFGWLAGIYMSMQTGERGAWLSIPILMLIWVSVQSERHIWRRLIFTSLGMLIVAVVIYLTVDRVYERVNLAYQDWLDYGNGHLDTSLGVRLQLWGVAIQLFLEHPFFGVGPGGFAQIMPKSAELGLITPLAATLGQGEVHNEILAKCAELGIFGLLATFAVLVLPCVIFFRVLKTQDSSARVASLMGLCLVTGFFVFGLTVEIFNLKMTAAFYATTLAILMANATRLPRDKES